MDTLPAALDAYFRHLINFAGWLFLVAMAWQMPAQFRRDMPDRSPLYHFAAGVLAVVVLRVFALAVLDFATLNTARELAHLTILAAIASASSNPSKRP